ncbi:MAG TPA: hypothetical protein VGB24_09460 [Longimicrobium sp.]|uniref:hypothetical protein n=1 Tax=Longimicrobium sp. TaxID=2029185 RepID=UPI002ED81B2A
MPTRRSTCLVLSLVALSTACAADSESTLPTSRSISRIATGKGQEFVFSVVVRKGGKVKKYRLRVDRAQQQLHLSAITDPACYPDDPSCNGDLHTPECSLADLVCEYGSYPAVGTDSVYNENPPETGTSWYDSGPYFCPMYVDDPHFEWKGHHFQIDGRADRVQLLPSNIGVPKGRYRLPPGPWISDDEQMRIWSGFIDGTCWVREELVAGFLRAHVGYIGWYRFQGTSEDLALWGGGQGEAKDGVWVSYGGEGSGSYLDPEAARVLERYMNEGVCTPGWMIFVNGAQVC